MLRNSFLHIPGIGAITEKRLWAHGISSWVAFVESYPVRLSPNRLESLQRYLDESRKHLENDNPNYFADLLPSKLQWRLFPEFRHSTAYLDIETTGLDRMFNDITIIGLYDGTSIFHYVRGQNLDDFRADLETIERIKIEKRVAFMSHGYWWTEALLAQELPGTIYNISWKGEQGTGIDLLIDRHKGNTNVSIPILIVGICFHNV